MVNVARWVEGGRHRFKRFAAVVKQLVENGAQKSLDALLYFRPKLLEEMGSNKRIGLPDVQDI